MKRIIIDAVLNGWIVKVGCKKVVFTNKTLMLSELGRYAANPYNVEKEYLSTSVNSHLVMVPEDGSIQSDDESCG